MSKSITTITSVLGAILLLSACGPEKAAEQAAATPAAGAISEVVQTKTGAVRGATVTDSKGSTMAIEEPQRGFLLASILILAALGDRTLGVFAKTRDSVSVGDNEVTLEKTLLVLR